MTPVQFDNLKHVLFGNQKQANTINDAVVGIVGKKLLERGVDLETESSVAEGIQAVLTEAITNPGSADELLIRLVAGDISYTNLGCGEVLTVLVDIPNPESPKVVFRIALLDSSMLVKEESVEVKAPFECVEEDDVDVDTKKHPELIDDFVLRVQALKETMLPMVPTAVKNVIADEAEQCLCIAEYYYRSR